MIQVTVLMTTYNENLDTFSLAINSILCQTYKKIKLLIIVDNPDNLDLINYIDKLKKKDNRINYVINQKNLGLPQALNIGIDLIKTKYIARMDADDIALPNRIEKQFEYMENHSDISLIGSNITYINAKGEKQYDRAKLPTNYILLHDAMKYANVMNHPTFFGKTEVFKKFKYRNLKYSQDYDFTCRLLENDIKVENINDILLLYRMSDTVSANKLLKQRISYYCIQKYYINKKLSQVDIDKIIDVELKLIDENREYNAIKNYDLAFDNLKRKKYFSSIIKFFLCFVTSKYQRKQMINLIYYYIIKKRNKI